MSAKRPLPGAIVGYGYATLVGMIWGTLLSTGKIERHGRLIVFRGMPKWAFGRGGSCVGACYLTAQNVTPEVLQHEEIHRQQWRRFGMAMPLLYWIAGRNPVKNRFEIEAGLELGGYLPRRPLPPVSER
jgi:hypothetical protein